jgi:hypothetical protein
MNANRLMTTAWHISRTGLRWWAAALLLGLGGAGCQAGGPTAAVTATTAELAATTASMGTGSDLSSAPELAGMMAGLIPPRVPDGIEGFRCDSTPTITTTTVCGHDFPSSIQLDWTACTARPDHGGGPGPSPSGGGGAGAGGVADDRGDGATSAGTVSITNTVSVDPAGACDGAATYTFTRSSNADVTTTETDGTSAEVVAAVSSTSTRQPDAKSFAQTKTYDVQRVDRDASGATTRTTHLAGQVSETFDGSGATPVRTIDGSVTRDAADGTTTTLSLTGVTLPVAGDCRWPTAGTVVETAADGTTAHTLVFGPTCGAATLDGAAIALPAHGIHLEGGPDDHGGHHGAGDQPGTGDHQGTPPADAGAAPEPHDPTSP